MNKPRINDDCLTDAKEKAAELDALKVELFGSGQNRATCVDTSAMDPKKWARYDELMNFFFPPQ